MGWYKPVIIVVMNRLEKRLSKELKSVPYPTTFHTENYTWVVETKLPSIGSVVLYIPCDYPFRPPRVKINGASYDDFLRLWSPRFRFRYHTMFGNRCLCACHSSILSSEKWYPGYRLIDILHDMKKLHHDKCLVAYSLFVEQIKERHRLPDDIDILSFL